MCPFCPRCSVCSETVIAATASSSLEPKPSPCARDSTKPKHASIKVRSCRYHFGEFDALDWVEGYGPHRSRVHGTSEAERQSEAQESGAAERLERASKRKSWVLRWRALGTSSKGQALSAAERLARGAVCSASTHLPLRQHHEPMRPVAAVDGSLRGTTKKGREKKRVSAVDRSLRGTTRRPSIKVRRGRRFGEFDAFSVQTRSAPDSDSRSNTKFTYPQLSL